jgi:1-acyl-sn-glycerol-3-phosphate acyltransferase
VLPECCQSAAGPAAHLSPLATNAIVPVGNKDDVNANEVLPSRAVPPKYLRRLLSVPVIVGLGLVLLIGLPIWLPMAFVADLFLGAKRKRAQRVLLFLLAMTGVEMAAVLKATFVWIRRFGQIRDHRSQESLQDVIRFYGHSIYRITAKFLGLRLEVTGLEAVADRAPLLCFGHHTSVLDSVIPVELLSHRAQYHVRYVIKKTLAYAPAFDICGHWVPVHFVDRSGKKSNNELEAIARLATDIPQSTAPVIYPEGTFFTPKRLEKSVARMREQDPTLVERAKKLRYVLPPRTGGAIAMLDAEPNVDVLFVVHAGFEPFVNLARILREIPFRNPVNVHLWRVERSEVPVEPTERYRWLFTQFELMDEWVAQRLDASRPAVANVSAIAS